MTKNHSTTWVLTTGTNFRFFCLFDPPGSPSWVSSEAWGAGSMVSIGLPYCFAFLASCLWVGKPRRPRKSQKILLGPPFKGGRQWNQVLHVTPNGSKWIQMVSAAHVSQLSGSAKRRTSFFTAPGRTSQVWPACGATKRRPEREFLRHFYCTKDLQQENT